MGLSPVRLKQRVDCLDSAKQNGESDHALTFFEF